ncbi:MAG: hypothetical protein HYZ16_11210 [Bacteroidetes bacterium]|nr:hypothetical protein [Bacteroidota bacterium]
MYRFFLLPLVCAVFVGQLLAQTGSRYALNFDGRSNDVTIKDHSSLNPTKEITVEAWIKPDTFAKDSWGNSIFCKHGWAKGNSGYVLRCGSTGKASFNIASSSGSWVEVISPSWALRSGQWSHVAGVFDGKAVTLYVNGIKVGSTSYSGQMTPSTGLVAKIGELAYGTDRNFDGEIDEVRVWGKAMDTTTLRQWMCRSVTSTHPHYSSLAAYYTLDAGTGSAVADHSTNKNNGSISGALWYNSGASIGDTSVYGYGWAGYLLSMTGDSGDVFTSRITRGWAQGVHLYQLKGKSQIADIKGAKAQLSTHNSWGVFIADPFYIKLALKYEYAALSSVTASNECFADLFSRSRLPLWQWQMDTTKIHPTGDSITIDSSSTWGEYIFGLYGDKHIRTSSGDSALCLGDTLHLFASGKSSFSFQWYLDGKAITGATGLSYPAIAGGKYHCVIKQDSACSVTTYPITITSYKKFNVSFPAPGGVCVSIDTVLLNQARPRGGVYSGTGITRDSLFLPSGVGAGKYLITYSVKNAVGCMSSASAYIDVWKLPSVKLKPGALFCDNIDSATLDLGTPKGGTYQGKGIFSNVFYPDSVGRKLGKYDYAYQYTDTNGCAATEKSTLELVFSTPISFSPFDTLCSNDQPVRIKVNPNQGIYTGTGVKGRDFYPSIAGAGSHVIGFSFTNLNGCVTTASDTAVVMAYTQASMSGLPSVCLNNDTLLLRSARPKGGVYQGPGLVSNVFDPQLAGAGNHVVAYLFTNAYGCTDTVSSSLVVHDTANLVVSALPDFCPLSPASNLDPVSPTGGIYEGNGVTNNQFNPAIAGPGTHIIRYRYTAPTGCISATAFTVQVLDKKKATFFLDSTYCANTNPVSLESTKPKGGVHTGAGVKGAEFQTAGLLPGRYWLWYAFTDGNGCQAVDSHQIRILEVPEVDLSAPGPLCTSQGETVLSGGSPLGGNYYLDGAITETIDPSALGVGSFVLSYRLTNQWGCTASQVRTVWINASPSKPTITQKGQTLKAGPKGVYSITWFGPQGQVQGESSDSLRPSTKGDYYVVFTSDSLCTAQSDVYSFIPKGIQNQGKNPIAVYPNPSSATMTIVGLEEWKEGAYQIIGIEGRLWAMGKIHGPSTLVNVDALPRGQYILSVQIHQSLTYYTLITKE